MVLQKNLSFFCPTSTDIILALFTLFTLIIGDSAPTTLVKSICGKTRSEHPVIYDANFGDAMSVVSQQIAVDRFGSAESGNGSDRIYGLGQCFGHVSLVHCRLCYYETRVKLPLCMPNISSRIYLDGCFLRNDNHNFSDEVMDSMDTHVCDYRANSSNSIRFGEIASGLVRNLSLEAPQEKGYFKIGSSRGWKITVFAFVQCWRSVNMSACRACLENASERALGCLPASDGRGLNAGCYVRYSNTKFYEENSSSRDSSLVVPRRLGAALGSIFAGAVIIVGVILYKRRGIGTSVRFDDMDGSSEIIKSISESHLGFKYEVLRKATKDFHEGNKLGQGGFGSVYKGVLPDGRDVAIKRLFFNTRQWVDQFFNEVNLISKVQHKNLVKLIGCSVEGPESLLVYEYLSNTSLDKFLFDSIKKRVLDWGRRMDIIVGTAEGLAYLHEASEVRIIHRDIKASNILLDEKFKPKIADFGLARYFAEDLSHISTGIAGTLGYMSPEYVVHGQLTEKADIYSYGVLVLEMITGIKNTSSISTSKEGHSLLSLVWEHYNSKSLLEIMDPCLRGHCPEEQVLKVFQVGLLCTQASPTLRPPTWKVVEMLTSMGKGIPSPTQPPFINIKGAEVGIDGSKSSNLLSSSSKSQASVNEMSLSIPQGR